MADESITSQLPATSSPAFTVEHETALDYLKSNGTAWAHNRKGERLLADIAAAGFARKEGNAYIYTGKRDEHQSNQESAKPNTLKNVAKAEREPASFARTAPRRPESDNGLIIRDPGKETCPLPDERIMLRLSAERSPPTQLPPSHGHSAAYARGWKWGRVAAFAGLVLVIGIVVGVLLKNGAESEPRNTHGSEPKPHKALSAEGLYALASPGVVTITLKNDDGKNIGIGSGFFLNDELVDKRDRQRDRIIAKLMGKADERPVQNAYVVTNYHVIQSAVDAEIALDDGTKGSVVAVVTEDEPTDLAVLSVHVLSAKFLVQLPLGDETPHVGAAVYSIGSPQGLANSLSAGMVSGIRENESGISWLQTTAPISPGSSGGPLLTSDGKVVGITTAIRRNAQNLNFAVPVSQLRQLLTAPYHNRELWQGRSFRQQENDAFAYVWRFPIGAGKNDGALALLKARDQIAKKSDSDAIASLEDAKSFVPSELDYLRYFLLGKAHSGLAPNVLNGAQGSLEEMTSAYRDSEHGRKALESLELARRLKPSFAPTCSLLFVHYQFAGQWDKALLAADSLVKLMPQCADAYLDRGRCNEELGRLDAALADFRKCVELNPASANGHGEIGNVWLDFQEYDKAIASYNTALTLKGSCPSACHWSIGNAYQRARKYEQAIRAYEKAQAFGFPGELCAERIAICRKLMR